MQESTLNEKEGESIRNNYASQSALLWGPTIEQIALHTALGWIPQNLASSQEQSREKPCTQLSALGSTTTKRVFMFLDRACQLACTTHSSTM